MEGDAYIAGVLARRDTLALQLEIIMASDIPSRVKNVRIKYITKEIRAMKAEIAAATLEAKQANCWHGVAVVLNTGVNGAVRCSKCEKESGDAYFKEMIERENAEKEKG